MSTVFSATERERLHGHTHAVKVKVTGPVARDGMIANYAVFKHRVRRLCEAWDEMYLIPAHSEYVTVRQENDRSASLSAFQQCACLHIRASAFQRSWAPGCMFFVYICALYQHFV